MPSPQQEAPAPPVQARRKAIWLVAGALALILAGAAVAVFASSGEPEASAESAPAPQDATTVVTLQPFIVNLADHEHDRYLRLSLSLVLACEAGTPPETEEGPEHAHVRDRVLSVLGVKRAEELISFEGKESLRLELRRHLTDLLPDRTVLDVLFTEFLVQ
jgi:flagellar basal body-associated protein FliL